MTIRYEITGVVAHARIKPLLPKDWIDITNADSNNGKESNDDNHLASSTIDIPDFLWENTPKQKTKEYRDCVAVYSHLPNGSTILDSKWILGRLLSSPIDIDEQQQQSPLLAICETYCFIGPNGFYDFAERMCLLQTPNVDETKKANYRFPDIMELQNPNSSSSSSDEMTLSPPSRPNWWVIKDATANGAGGIWVVGRNNAYKFFDAKTTPLYEQHKYVAQQYVWPPLLYKNKKCHVRVYVTITNDGRAYIHDRAFLHVANEDFVCHTEDQASSNEDTNTTSRNNVVDFDDCIHITNCCANSHDNGKFVGEILADFSQTSFTERDGQMVIPLADFYPSIKASVSALVSKAFPFMTGGDKNSGFEYCGMDFILSYNNNQQPLAYLLEINAPPSQDTATGLIHAENLHNDVLRDWISFWIIPRIMSTKYGFNTNNNSNSGGWRCVHEPRDMLNDTNSRTDSFESDLILPSKAAILNKIRWALFEKRMIKEEQLKEGQLNNANDKIDNNDGTHQHCYEKNEDCVPTIEQISRFARSQFPYFSSYVTMPLLTSNQDNVQQQYNPIFFENAGGAQVPQIVIDCMTASLQRRHRSATGHKTKVAARQTIQTILGASKDDVPVFGLNATTLLSSLAQYYVQYKLLTATDELVISTENHKANFDPWLSAATKTGAKIKFWSPSCASSTYFLDGFEISNNLQDLITSRTKIVAIPHASNVLGSLYRIDELSKVIKSTSGGRAHIIVDGVAAAPHVCPNFGTLLRDVDWYVISIHKLFGPHLGVLLTRRGQAMEQLTTAFGRTLPGMTDDATCFINMMESGTVNIEACAGVIGLGQYFKSLAKYYQKANDENRNESSTTAVSNCLTGEGPLEKSSSCPSLTDLITTDPVVSFEEVQQAYAIFGKIETSLVKALIEGLSRSQLVTIFRHTTEGDNDAGADQDSLVQLPTVSFIHKHIESQVIYTKCREMGVVCRNGFFLCTKYFAAQFCIDDRLDGFVRISLAHYNTIQEVNHLCDILENIPGWFGSEV